MMDFIKKTFLVGLGATVVTKEKIEKLLEDLVNQGKLSSDEAKKMASKMMDDGKEEFEKYSQDLKTRFQEMLEKANFASKKHVDELEARIKALESKHHQ